MAKNKHCVLDVTPGSVERLQYAQFCPIVVLINVDSRQRLRDLRAKASGHGPKLAAANSTVSTKKLIEQALKIQKHHSHLLTGSFPKVFVKKCSL